jgi:hypothetical protein
VGKMGKGIREQETEPIADRAREGQKPGNMIAYSPEQIISRADAAGQAAYAAVIRAGGAAGVAERAYSRAYLRTVPPCWIALLAPPIQPRRPKSGAAGVGVHARGRVRVNPQWRLRRNCGGHRARGRGAKPHPGRIAPFAW